MGCPQLGFPRLRLAGERATSIAIGRSYSVLGGCAAESWTGWHMICESGRRGDIFGQYGGLSRDAYQGDLDVQRD
jgi:hypothetical protein